VFDNAPNPDSIRLFLPRSVSGHVLVTSRHQSWRELGISVCVEELPRDDAVAFLLRRTGESDRTGAARLADELGCLPLALECAAAYIETTGRTLREYLALVRERHQVLLEGPKPADYPATLGATWEISLRGIETELPPAAELMRLCSFLAPDDVPLALLREATDRLPEPITTVFADPLTFDACIAALRRFSLVKVERDALSMHRLVQLVTRERIPEPERLAWVERALRVAEAGFPKGGLAGNLQPEARRVLPHALAALAHAEDLPECAVPAGRVMTLAGNYLSALGFHDQGRARLERALRLFESSGADVDRYVANLLDDLSFVLLALGDAEPALRHAERAMQIDEKRFGASHPRVYVDLMKQAWVLLAGGALERARDHYERALPGIRLAFGADHPLEGQGLAALSRTLFELGETARAYETAARAVTILDKPELYHPLLMTAWTSLAQLALFRGDLDAASVLVERSLAVGEAAYGEDHPLIAMCLSLRGALEAGRGELWKARRSLERALSSEERTCKRLHDDTAVARSLLGDLLRRMGEPGHALATLRHAERGLDRICGNRARIEAHVAAALAALAYDQGDREGARGHAQRALAALAARYPERHPFRIPVLSQLARIAEAEVDLAGARSLAEAALACGAEAFEGEHPDLIEVHALLSRIAAVRGEREAAAFHGAREAALRRRWPHAGAFAPGAERSP
jgi:tetratricopeptide (TPR) repeat protein